MKHLLIYSILFLFALNVTKLQASEEQLVIIDPSRDESTQSGINNYGNCPSSTEYTFSSGTVTADDLSRSGCPEKGFFDYYTFIETAHMEVTVTPMGLDGYPDRCGYSTVTSYSTECRYVCSQTCTAPQILDSDTCTCVDAPTDDNNTSDGGSSSGGDDDDGNCEPTPPPDGYNYLTSFQTIQECNTALQNAPYISSGIPHSPLSCWFNSCATEVDEYMLYGVPQSTQCQDNATYNTTTQKCECNDGYYDSTGTATECYSTGCGIHMHFDGASCVCDDGYSRHDPFDDSAGCKEDTECYTCEDLLTSFQNDCHAPNEVTAFNCNEVNGCGVVTESACTSPIYTCEELRVINASNCHAPFVHTWDCEDTENGANIITNQCSLPEDNNTTDPNTDDPNPDNNTTDPNPNDPNDDNNSIVPDDTNSKLDSLISNTSETNTKLQDLKNLLSDSNSKLDSLISNTDLTNSNLNDISSKLDTSNGYLDSIDDALHKTADSEQSDLKDSLSSLDGLLNDFSNFKNNIVNDLNNINNSFQNAEDLFNGDLALNSPDTPSSCPQSGVIYGKQYDIDLCKTVSPYSNVFYNVFYLLGFFGILITLSYIFILKGVD